MPRLTSSATCIGTVDSNRKKFRPRPVTTQVKQNIAKAISSTGQASRLALKRDGCVTGLAKMALSCMQFPSKLDARTQLSASYRTYSRIDYNTPAPPD